MMRRSLALLLTALVSACATMPAALPLSRDDSATQAERYRRVLRALRYQKPADALSELKGVVARNPQDDVALYNLAVLSARAGDREAAIAALKKLERTGSCLVPVGRTFGTLGQDPDFLRIAERMEKKSPPLERARLAFTLPDRSLVPEGIAFDPVDKVFYVGSLHLKKVVRAVPGAPGEPARLEDLSRPADELDSVVGLRVDAERRRLWVVSSAQPFQQGFKTAWDGRGSLFVYDLTSGKLLKRIWPSTKRPHFLNDVVVARDGTAYATDSYSGEVFRARLELDEAQPLFRWGTLEAPNGLALSEDESRLYVADSLRGIHVLDLSRAEAASPVSAGPAAAGPRNVPVAALGQPVGIWPADLDGLFVHRGSLVGILNTMSGGRILRLKLAPGGDAVVGSEVLECRSSRWRQATNGVLVGETLYYIGSSQFGAFDPARMTFDPARLQAPEVLALDLTPAGP